MKNLEKTKDKSTKIKGLYFILFTLIFLLNGTAFAQFVTEADTLTIAINDSLSQAWDSNAKKLGAVDLDTNSTFTSAKFLIQTIADTASAKGLVWRTVQYEGTDITVTITAGKIVGLPPTNVNFYKRYIRFKCLDSSDATETEDAPRTVVPLRVGNF